MIEMSQMILIAGAGQNVGKTTLACRIIQQLCKEKETTAIKISGHHHQLTNKQRVIFQTHGLIVAEEQDRSTNKDSSLFLQHGAAKSFFIQVNDQDLKVLSAWIQQNISGWVVCESAALGQVVMPGKAVFVKGSNGKIAPWKFSYQEVKFNGKDFDPTVDELLNGLK